PGRIVDQRRNARDDELAPETGSDHSARRVSLYRTIVLQIHEDIWGWVIVAPGDKRPIEVALKTSCLRCIKVSSGGDYRRVPDRICVHPNATLGVAPSPVRHQHISKMNFCPGWRYPAGICPFTFR